MEQETGKEVNRRNYLTAAATGAAIMAASALAGPAQAQKDNPPGHDVRVINKPSEPVPVTQQGAIKIDTSTPLPVRDVDRSAQEPVHILLQIEPNKASEYAVPAGKRLVIEHVSGLAQVSNTEELAGVQ